MLDLDPAVQLEEVEVATVEHELDRARAAVADRPAERDRGFADARSQIGIEGGGGGLLEHLLMATLDRALPLAEREHRAVLVGEELNLDMTRPLDVALAEDGVVAEGRLRLALGRSERLVQLCGRADDPHPAAAAARGRLDDEREADLCRCSGRQNRNAGFQRDPLRLELVATLAKRLRGRADEDEAGCLDGLREVGVLGQEAVTGVDRVCAGLLGGPDVLLGEEVALDLDGLVGDARMQRAEVVRCRDGHGRDACVATGAEDASRDLAAVRD